MTRSIGALRHRVTLEQTTRVADGGGGASESWIAVADLWAAIRPVSGDERVVGEQPAGHVSHAIEIRYRTGVIPAMRFRLGVRRFAILAVLDVDERRTRLNCLCREQNL